MISTYISTPSNNFSNECLHFPLIIIQSKRLLSLPFGDVHVFLCISLCGNIVPPITQFSFYRSQLVFHHYHLLYTHPCFPMVFSLPLFKFKLWLFGLQLSGADHLLVFYLLPSVVVGRMYFSVLPLHRLLEHNKI